MRGENSASSLCQEPEYASRCRAAHFGSPCFIIIKLFSTERSKHEMAAIASLSVKFLLFKLIEIALYSACRSALSAVARHGLDRAEMRGRSRSIPSTIVR